MAKQIAPSARRPDAGGDPAAKRWTCARPAGAGLCCLRIVISPRLRVTVDKRELDHLIEKLEQYSGAPIPVPGGDAEAVELPKPVLERDDDTLARVRLRFDVRGAPDYWVDVFNREAGGPGWPPGLPIPTLGDDRIQIARLPVDDVRQYVEALRAYFAFTNRQAERQRPEAEARRQESESAARRFDKEFKQAQRFLDTEFGPSGD
jgi:hypothetical protein